ncbi:MAG: hypothetical protein ACRD8Z_24045, partial [Nitrososphaeraceae archaeon]
MSSRFKPTKKPKLIDPIKSERLRRTIRAYNEVEQQYIPDRKNDKNELETSLYRQKYPQNVERELIKLIRVKVPRGSFELDEAGTVDEKGTVQEALVHTTVERVINPNPDIEKGESDVYAWCSTKHGIYMKPLAMVKRDELGNPVSSKVTGQKVTFYIPFTEENVRRVLDEFNYECTQGYGLAVATRQSGENWYGGVKYTVYNLDEFIHSKFEDVLGANKGGFLKDKIGRVVEEGAVQKYLMDKAAKREQAENEFKAFKEKQRTKGN